MGIISAHLGTAFLILGVGIVSSFSVEREVILSEGDDYLLSNVLFSLKEISQTKGPNYISRSATIEVNKGDNNFEIIAEKRNYLSSNQMITEAGIEAGLIQDYYVTLGDNLKDDTWSLKLQIKPFVRWIWFGALLISLGTFLSSLNIMKRSNE